MKLTIIGPENDVVEITQKGNYLIQRNLAFNLSVIEGIDDKPQVIARGHISISENHLKISIDDIIALTDLGSTFWSYLNGKKFEETIIAKEGQYQLTLGQVPTKLEYKK